MVDVGPTTNGARRSIHISAATIGAVASTIGILVYVIGFVSGYLMVRQNVSDLQASSVTILARLELLSERMTKLEDKADYTAQGVADLKALKAGTNR